MVGRTVGRNWTAEGVSGRSVSCEESTSCGGQLDFFFLPPLSLIIQLLCVCVGGYKNPEGYHKKKEQQNWDGRW